MKACVLVALTLFMLANNSLALTTEDAAFVNNVLASGKLPLSTDDRIAIKKMGSEALDPIAEAYEKANIRRKTELAHLLWRLGLENEKATQALLKDARTRHPDLRLQVQYALGSVSGDTVIVETLLDTMRNDPNGLFRDKAACSMANDLRHLNYEQKYLLFRGLVDGLNDEKYQVRKISIKALNVHLGQKFGYKPESGIVEREASIARWHEWLEEYRQEAL